MCYVIMFYYELSNIILCACSVSDWYALMQ